MGARLGVVIGAFVLALSGGLAHAQRSTLEPSKLSLFVPSGWQVTRARTGDFLHWETATDGGRSFDVSVERLPSKCKAWKAETGTKKEFPAYWPKRGRTAMFASRGDGKIRAKGCLADTTGGSLVVQLDITVEDPTYKPSKDDVTALRDVLDAILEGSEDLPPLAGATTTTTTSGGATTGQPGINGGPPPGVGGSAPVTLADLGDNAVKGGTVATIPRVDIAVRLPKASAWIVGTRGESTIKRADKARPALTATLFPLASRTCNEWRVDQSTNDLVTYETKAAYLPSAVKTGAFRWMSNGMQIALCLPTKVGAVGVGVEYSGDPASDEMTLIRQLIEGIAVGAAKHAAPLVAAPTLLEGGTQATASIGSIWLPKGAQWRVTNGSVERYDRGKYFSLSSMTRPSACDAAKAKEQPYLPAGVKATVETRAWGTTVVKACVGTTRTIELTLAYDGAIAAADHALIKSLVEAFVGTTKKSASKS